MVKIPYRGGRRHIQKPDAHTVCDRTPGTPRHRPRQARRTAYRQGPTYTGQRHDNQKATTFSEEHAPIVWQTDYGLC